MLTTFSFIGSDKNSGKTTAFNHVYQRLLAKGTLPETLCLNSIGINGENFDYFEENFPKPKITVFPDTFFVTENKNIEPVSGSVEMLDKFQLKSNTAIYSLFSAKKKIEVVMEGPNLKKDVVLLKKALGQMENIEQLLIDGSIDRQFLADPLISDGIFLSLLITNRAYQQQKLNHLLTGLQLPQVNKKLHSKILSIIHMEPKSVLPKSILLGEDFTVHHLGTDPPFIDQQLKQECKKRKNQKAYLYLNGALTNSLHQFLVQFNHCTIVLNNFTLYQNFEIQRAYPEEQSQSVFLLNPICIKEIFIKKDALENNIELPENIPVTLMDDWMMK